MFVRDQMRHWYRKKRFLIPICLSIVLFIAAIIIGTVVKTKSSNTIREGMALDFLLIRMLMKSELNKVFLLLSILKASI